MPSKTTVQRARRDKRQGKAPTTQAGEFVREEMEHVRRGKHGARSPEQAIAIGLSKARRSGVKLGPPPAGTASAKKQDDGDGRTRRTRSSAKRSRSRTAALKREGRSAASKQARSRHAHKVARRRSAASRSASARKAARTRVHAHA